MILKKVWFYIVFGLYLITVTSDQVLNYLAPIYQSKTFLWTPITLIGMINFFWLSEGGAKMFEAQKK